MFKFGRIKNKFNIKHFLKKAKNFDEFESKKYEPLIAYYKEHAKTVSSEKLGLKLIVISDTHGDLAFGDRFKVFMDNIKEYDLCVILGDIYVYELDKICEIVPAEKIIALRGNHDNLDVYDKHKIKKISGKVYCVNGVRIAGIEGSNRYKNENAPLFTHYESLKIACTMPQDADILISHDVVFEESRYDRAHEGMVGLTYYVLKNEIKYHLHGHIHKKYHNRYENGTKEISVYGCEYLEL